ncbi:DUF1328 domain-containing protein [Pseudoflavitalea sp. X16]|uniref:DUF1328 domain-containing protein n=1 Tax=Paraflavitalea devenefica TaxID=2716334 RepID=UPI00141F2C00|nr:DUF1328 domain-containing protein [Paraflavitalea devenefica]NII26320.1 DUF1328 domain-containing protein [Paraflavitalea devenefica]
MFRWSIVFITIAVIAGLFAFAGIAASVEGVARVVFFIFMILFVGSLIANSIRADKQ